MIQYDSDEYLPIFTIYQYQTGKYLLKIHFRGFRVHNMNKLTTNMHYHHEKEIIYVLSGKGLYTYGTDSNEIIPGDIHLCHENIPHEIVSNPFEPVTYALFSISISENPSPRTSDCCEKIIESFLNNHQMQCKNQHQLLSFFEVLEQHKNKYTELKFIFHQTIVFMILEILYLLADDPKAVETTINPLKTPYHTAMEYIEKNLMKKLYIQEIADVSYTSVRNLQLLFQKHAGTTITDYINERRMEAAKNYLRINTPIKDTAYLIGIEDTSRFSKLFKQHTGLTPTQYRKLNSENPE